MTEAREPPIAGKLPKSKGELILTRPNDFNNARSDLRIRNRPILILYAFVGTLGGSRRWQKLQRPNLLNSQDEVANPAKNGIIHGALQITW